MNWKEKIWFFRCPGGKINRKSKSLEILSSFSFLVIRKYFILKVDFCQQRSLWPKFGISIHLYFIFCLNSISFHTAATFWHLTTYKHKDSLWKIKNMSSVKFSNLLYRPNILSSLIRMMMMMLLRRPFGYLNRKFYREFSQILLSVVWKETFHNNNHNLV